MSGNTEPSDLDLFLPQMLPIPAKIGTYVEIIFGTQKYRYDVVGWTIMGNPVIMHDHGLTSQVDQLAIDLAGGSMYVEWELHNDYLDQLTNDE